MYFKRLEIHGFKSFADPAVIEFNEGITAIVGPNGSGKSNISDAIRWVLGEQSAKELRGGKMEEVIFNGTESRRARGMAEVTLVIDNAERKLNVDYTEVAVTRRMYRSGESEYLINGNNCRLKDIRELIMDTGIGVDGYSIIGQGRIADIISNKTESRRKIFEEAAGVVAYKTRRAEAVKKLETTSSNLERIDDIVSELDDRMGTLKRESDKAKKFQSLNERYRELEVNILLKNIEDAQEKAGKFKVDISDLKAKAEFTEDNRKRTGTDILDAEKRIERVRKQISEIHEKLPEVAEALSSARKEQQFNQERRKAIAADKQRNRDQLAALEIRIEAAEKEMGSLKDARGDLSARHHELNNDLEEKKRDYQRISRGSDESRKIIDEGNDRLYHLHSEAAAKKSEAESIESYSSSLEKRKRQLRSDSEAAESQKKVYEQKLRELENRMKTAQNNRERIEGEVLEAGNHFRQIREKREEARKSADRLRIQIGQMESRRKTIEEMEHNFEGYSNAVRYIMQSGLIGVEGVAADMLDVPAGMETAIDTALGAGRQNIVIRDDRAAKKAVTALKHNRAGRLTFLPVDTIEAKAAQVPPEIAEDEGFIGLAVELVHYNERYRNIFRYLLGRTGVVRDLDAAIRLSKNHGVRLKYVTLEGEVVNAGGAITGGRYRNQGATLSGRRNEISRLGNEIGAAQDALRKTENNIADLDRTLKMLTENINHLNGQQRENDLKLTALKPQIQALNTSADRIDQVVKKNGAEIESIDRELRETEHMAETLMEASRNAEEGIRKITREISEAEDAVAAKLDAVEAARKALTEARIALHELESEQNGQESIISRAKKELEELRRERTGLNDRGQELEREENRLNTGSSDASSEVRKLEQQMQTLEDRLDEFETEQGEIEKKKTALSGEIIRYEQEINACRDQQYRLEVKAAKNETQLEHLKDKLWDEFELSMAQAMDLKWEVFVLSTSINEARDLKNQIRGLGDVNISAIREYESVRERYRFLQEQQTDVKLAQDELNAIIDDMDRKIDRKFRENFNHVEYNFERIFTELFGGGHAELHTTDERHPLESDIEIVSQPPGKRLQNINLLSGGEKTMTALALMFAVLCVKPTPFCILDEVEAALDDENIARFSTYLKNFHQTQFALITHQKATMEHADTLYGITMAEEGVSKIISLKLGDPEAENFVE